MKKICAIAAAVAAFSCLSAQAANLPNRDFDPNTASLNELLAYNQAVDREREASLARGRKKYEEDPQYITRSIQAFKEIYPYASITDFENFIKSDETLKAYYTGTDTFRNLNRDQMYSDYRQFFPEQENPFNSQRKGSLEDREDTNWFTKQLINLVKSGEKVVRCLISPHIFTDAQREAVNDLNKFPNKEIAALKSKQLQAYKINRELEDLKDRDWFNMPVAVRNNTVQKIDSYKKALNNLKPTAREQYLIDSGVVSAYDRAMDYKLALDKERAEFEGNTLLSKLNPLLGPGNEIRGESESYEALAREMDARYLEYQRYYNNSNK